MKKSILGIAIGGTKTAVSHGVYDGEAFRDIVKEEFKTNPNDPYEVLEGIYGAIDHINRPFDLISVICGGPMDIELGTIDKPEHLPGFDHFNLKTILSNKYGKTVTLLNDADACALAEWKFGAGRGNKNMAFVTFGTGFGAGLILNGCLYTGNNGMAGEVGHVRLNEDGPLGYGKTGTVEGFVSGGNIAKWAKERVKGTNSVLNSMNEFSTKDIAQAARRGDSVALSIMDEVGKRLGQAISILIDTLNVDKVVIGGIYPRCVDLLEKPFFASLKEETIRYNLERCDVVPSGLGEHIDEYSSLIGCYKECDDMKTFYERYPELEPQKENIEAAIDAMVDCYLLGGKILVCGNGGSAADSSHIVGELMKGFMSKRPLNHEIASSLEKEFASNEIASKLQTGVPCIDLTAQAGLITAFMNDVDPNLIYAQQVVGYSSNCLNDVVLGISTSGNSKNVVFAIRAGKALGLKTIALTGAKDSALSEHADICVKAPEEETFKIQEYHLPIYHYICQEIEKRVA